MAVLTVVADDDALAHASAEQVTTRLALAIAERGAAVVSLAGGRTPQRLYLLLGDETHPWRARIEWSRIHLFWGDERHVPPDHPDSNFGMANTALIEHVPIPTAQIHRIRAELPNASDAAHDYERALRDGFAQADRADQTFDVMLLGLGEDGHIASIFPKSPLLTWGSEASGNPTRSIQSSRHSGRVPSRVAAVWVPHLDGWRITLTPAALLDARAIIVMTSGPRKADAMRAALELPEDVARWPAQLLRHAVDRVEWITDRAAASRLSRRDAAE